MAPISSYRSLCISDVNRNISDNALKDEIYKKFEKYGDYFNIKISFFNNQRVAYINFTYDEDARRAHQEFHSLHLFGRSVKIEPVPLKSTRPKYRQESRSPSPFSKKRPEESPPYSTLNHEIRSNAQKSYRGEIRYGDYADNIYREPPKPRYTDEYAYDDYNYKPQYKVAPKYKNEWFYPLDATRSLFIGNVPEDIEENDLYKIFKRFGPITDIDVKRAMKGKNNTYAFVKFFTLDYALTAKEEMQGQLIGKMPCKIGFGKPSPTKKLWVGGLGPWTTLSILEKEFDKFGPILKIDYLKGDSFAFILYDTVDSAESAYQEMRGIELDGTPETKIMTDFSDTKTTFYDGSSVSTFLESYHKPVNYLNSRPMRNPPRNDPYANEMMTNERVVQYGDEYDTYKKPLANTRSPYEDEKYMARPKMIKRSPSFSPINRSKRSSSSEYYAGNKQRVNPESPIKYGQDTHLQVRKGDRNGNFVNVDKGKKAYDETKRSYTKSSSRSRTSSYHSQSSAMSNRSSKLTPPPYKVPKTNNDPQYNRAIQHKNYGGQERKPHMQENANVKSMQQQHKRASSTSTRSTSSASHEPINSNGPASKRITTMQPKDKMSEAKKTQLALIKCTSLSSIIKTLEPAIWMGEFTIKNSLFPLTLYFYRGDSDYTYNSVLPMIINQKELQIVQRFRLDSSKIEDMAHQINSMPLNENKDNLEDFLNDPCSGYSIFFALDKPKATEGDVDQMTNKSHKRQLKDLIHYLKQKNAAGVVFLDNSLDDSQTMSDNTLMNNNILYAFPPCDFTKQFFASNFPNLDVFPKGGSPNLNHAIDIQNYLLIVVLKNSPKKKH